MSVDDQAAYLARLGLEAEPPSAEALIRLQRAQVEQVPYETLWIHTGQRWGVDLSESVARIANGRRGATASTSTAPSACCSSHSATR